MSFWSDKQTLDDLNITGKYRGDSIFNLFDRTHTRGGALLLEQLFQQPLTDAAAINARTAIFRYFQDKAMTFPVNRELCDAVEHYLGVAERNSRVGAALATGRKKLLQTLGAGTEYEMMHTGIVTVIKLLHIVSDFFTRLNAGNNSSPYTKTIAEVRQTLDNAGLGALLKEPGTARLSLRKVMAYDHLLRGTHLEQMKRLLEVLYEVDVYITVAAIARERKFAWARAIPFTAGSNRIVMTNVFHPRLTGATTNTVHASHEHNMIFLTGANMAGKSTFMKSFGIAVYLAHMGFPVAAESMEFSVQDGMYTSINVADNLGRGYSHFYAEVLRVKEVATAVSQSKNLVVIFDELFKGTNVKDAYDATVAVTAAFAENRNVTFIVSTHIVEAGQALQEHSRNIRFVCFPTIINKGIPQYTYKLQQGISNDRHGMMIITNEGIIDTIKGKLPLPANEAE